MADLTPKQRLFIAEYLIDKNATQAAIRAGYSEKTAQEQSSRLLSNVIIQEEINKHIEKQVKRVLITSDYVIDGIKEVAERCLQRVPVMVGRGEDRHQLIDDETGEGVWQFDSGGANRAFELLGKHLKLFTDKVEIDATISDKFASMSVSEKAKFLIDKENDKR